MTKYTKIELEAILRDTPFEYHRVNLPYGLHTSGQDRSGTSNLIFPESLEGNTVLDVGCALGFFCHEAEYRGAKRVVGLEMRDTRFQQALLLKDICNSHIELYNINVLDFECEGGFDYVLLLNVLHHVPEPMRVLRKLSVIVNKRLIIEFPTFDDKRFRRFLPRGLHVLLNRLPLIGVSSLKDKTFDQTFIFSPKALERILLDHGSLFQSVAFVVSPIPGRMIAFCDK